MEYEEFVPKEHWSVCKICQMSIKDMTKRLNQYFSQRFYEHLRDIHHISFEDYLNQYEDVQTPYCACGCGERTNISKRKSSKLLINKYVLFHSTASDPKFQESVERSKVTRLGPGNPMFGKEPWNQGLTKDTDKRVAAIAEKRKDYKFSKETLQKMSDSAKKRLVHGHTGHHHSEETKRIIAQKTIEAIQRGVFKHTKTKPHIAMSLILDEIKLLYKEEQSIEFWLFDFLLLDFNLYIEVDGDYFHSNPLLYPNGPETKTQRANYYRDQRKDAFCKENGIHVVRFWENDILSKRDQVKNTIMEIIDEITKNN